MALALMGDRARREHVDKLVTEDMLCV
jgi:hypothetical protein